MSSVQEVIPQNIHRPDDEVEDEEDMPVDDPQLTIRIPNPNAYMARQNNWVGRRGKPRCDFCRANNLKCDRVLPACNHCVFQKRECSYTPLPTPAHRGIPRCDRCRTLNFKCDRALPTCNYCLEGQVAKCHYSSKRRHRNPDMGDSESNPDAPYQFSSFSATPQPTTHLEAQNAKVYRDGAPLDPTRHYRRPNNPKAHFESWSHFAFPALPAEVLLRLADINPSEIPSREIFDENLNSFVDGLRPELRDTALFSITSYTSITSALNKSTAHTLSPRIQAWIMAHRAVSGSGSRSLILIPNDSVFQLPKSELETFRNQYVAQVDSKSAAASAKLLEQNIHCLRSFDRLPVLNQVYDILAAAHCPGHRQPYAMLKEVRSIRMAGITWPMAEMFVRLCPKCVGATES